MLNSFIRFCDTNSLFPGKHKRSSRMKINTMPFFLTVFAVLVLGACFNPYSEKESGETATVTINLGGSNARAAICFPGDTYTEADIDYTVTFTNTSTGQIVNATVTKGPSSTSASATVAVGVWKIKVQADLLTTPFGVYALASEIHNIQAGITIPIQMKRPVTVIFNTGLGSTVTDQIVPNGGFVERPANPSRSVYNFENWYTSNAFSTVWDFTNDPVSFPGPVTIYANWTHQYVVSTFAGDGTSGNANGPGTLAKFSFPRAVTVAGSGDLYVSDYNNYQIKKIESAFPNTVSTIAGSGSSGSTDGSGAAASFNHPAGIAIDSSGNIYVADSFNNMIRKIDSGGNVITLAGSTSSGSTDGLGTAASFNLPTGVAVDSFGNVYVADAGNNMIRKIDSVGNVTTLAGSTTAGSADGLGAAASFNYPLDVALDSAGNVYVVDAMNYLIRKIDSAGNVVTIAGDGTAGSIDGPGLSAQFNYPNGIAVDSSGNIYVADSSNNRIRKIDSAGNVVTIAGSGTSAFADGSGDIARFDYPYSVAVDNAGNVYIADCWNYRVRKISLAP